MRVAGAKLGSYSTYRGLGNQLWDLAGNVPSLDLNFAESKSLVDATTGQNLVTFTRASSGTFVGSDGVLQTAANDVPRFDHNPTTGESLGLLVEEQRTNSIRNNTMVGAAAGTPGTAPTNWTVQTSINGLNRTIVGTGTENGITYIDVQYFGTTTGAISGAVIAGAEANTQVAASSGQTWTGSWYVRLIGGSTSGLSLFAQQMTERDAAGTIVSGSTQLTSILSTLSTAPLIQQRITQTRTLNGATTAFLTNEIRLSAPTATAIDITLRIGLPQLEQGVFATSVIPTTTATATRSADVASITGTNFSSWYRQDQGTVFADGAGVNNVSGATRRYLEIRDNSTTDRLILGYSATNNNRFLVVDDGATVADITATSTPTAKAVGAYRVNSFQLSSNGALGTEDGVGAVPVPDQMFIGSQEGGTASTFLNGTIRRLTYWPARLANSTLQTITL